MRFEPDPVRFTMHPAVWGACCLTGAALWLGSFKLMAAVCGLIASVTGVTQ
jgi:hypothetical protein